MRYAWKIPRMDGTGHELCISDGSPRFWQKSSAAPHTTVITWSDDDE